MAKRLPVSSVVHGIERLTFKGLDDVVRSFITKRHEYFGVQRVEFGQPASNDGPVLHISAENVLTDFDYVEQALAKVQAGAGVVTLAGAVPGTQFDRLTASGAATGPGYVLQADTQLRFNNQFNLRKVKRHKMFRLLLEREPDLWKLDIEGVNAAVKRHHLDLALYGVSADAVHQKTCPHCAGVDLVPLHGRASQPVIGYVSPEIALYVQCSSCGLGFMTPHVAPARTGELYDDYDAADGAAPLDVIYAAPMAPKVRIALDMAVQHVPDNARVLDLGGGSGRFSMHAKQRQPNWTVVHSDFDARQHPELAQRGIETKAINMIADDLGQSEYDLITAFEVIEHLDFKSFANLMVKVKAALRPGGCFLLTTPDIDSPAIHAFDFFNAYAPHHLLLFGKSWLTTYFQRPGSGFEVVGATAGADLFDDGAAYFDYYAQTSPTPQLRAAARVMKTLLADERNCSDLLSRGYGSEVIMLLRA